MTVVQLSEYLRAQVEAGQGARRVVISRGSEEAELAVTDISMMDGWMDANEGEQVDEPVLVFLTWS